MKFINFNTLQRKLEREAINGLTLNIGCGTRDCSNLGKVVNLDINPVYGKVVKSFVIGDAKNLPFKMNVFDTILMIEVIEHIEEKYVLSVLKQCYNILKRNGKLVIHTPNRKRWTLLIRNLFSKKKYPIYITVNHRIYGTLIHFKEYTKEELHKLLKKAGFKKIDIQTSYLSLPFLPNFGINVRSRFGRNIFAEAKKV